MQSIRVGALACKGDGLARASAVLAARSLVEEEREREQFMMTAGAGAAAAAAETNTAAVEAAVNVRPRLGDAAGH